MAPITSGHPRLWGPFLRSADFIGGLIGAYVCAIILTIGLNPLTYGGPDTVPFHSVDNKGDVTSGLFMSPIGCVILSTFLQQCAINGQVRTGKVVPPPAESVQSSKLYCLLRAHICLRFILLLISVPILFTAVLTVLIILVGDVPVSRQMGLLIACLYAFPVQFCVNAVNHLACLHCARGLAPASLLQARATGTSTA